MSTKMTLDNTARQDQTVRVGKVWKSPASSKPTYIVEVDVPVGGTSADGIAVELDGSFKVVDSWSHYEGAGSGVGDQVSLFKGPASTGALICSCWDHATAPVATGDMVRVANMDPAETSVSSDELASTLHVAAASVTDTQTRVYIAVQLEV